MLKFIVLGAIQGLTEFLPVSSSGHLVIAQHFLGQVKNVIFLDVLLHIGTVLALLTFFFKDIISALKNFKMIGYIAVVTLITGIIGITFKKIFESFFHSVLYVAVFLIFNGFILILTRFFRDGQREPNIIDSTIMGAAQGLAIAPGISRSGMTIAVLLSRGIKKEEAVRFSFMASIPAIIGAFFMELKDMPSFSVFNPKELILSMGTSYLFGLVALLLLMKTVKMKKFYLFGYYCFILGISLLFFSFSQ